LWPEYYLAAKWPFSLTAGFELSSVIHIKNSQVLIVREINFLDLKTGRGVGRAFASFARMALKGPIAAVAYNYPMPAVKLDGIFLSCFTVQRVSGESCGVIKMLGM
jgi:hypothetical protein